MSLRPGAVNFDEKWSGIKETIHQVVQLHRVRMATWNDHYSDIYALCEAFPVPFAEKLYRETEQLLQEFVAELSESLLALSGTPLLSSYHKHWLNYQKGALFLNNLFSYFNRVSLRKYSHSVESIDYPLPGLLDIAPKVTHVYGDAPVQIRQMALSAWKNKLLEKLRKPLVKELLEEIGRDRNGESSNLSMVRDIVSSLVEVDEYNKDSSLLYYQEVFEVHFLYETGQFYRKEASKLTSELSCSEYIKQVVTRLRDARSRGERFLHPTSVTKFFRECEARLVEDFRESYLNPHVCAMVREERTEDLSNLFIMLRPLPHALDPLVREFEEHVKSQGHSALRKLQLDKNPNVTDFMTSVLSIYDKFCKIISEVFGSHKSFYNALDSACKAFVNIADKPRQHPKAPLLLARYCDQLLKKSSKGISEQEVEDKLDRAITVFRYVEDKDMFQRFYTRMLSRRLVQHLSLSMEAEESMIQKLKHACGYEYTSRLQRMIVDIKLSAEGNTNFNDHLKAKGEPLPISFSALVLQSAAWPLMCAPCSLVLPESLLPVLKRFELFYTSKHSGRKLTWLHQMSTGELKMTYLKRPYTICVTAFQMTILLAFNQSVLHTYTSLQQYTQLDVTELTASVQSLVDSRVLLAEPDQDVGVSSIMKLNQTYSNKRTKFKVTSALQKETQQEIDQTQFNVQEDRKLHIQAAIVRVMKSRKSLKHNQLVEETITQVKGRFSPEVQTIKKCIETLIDKQYLERSSEHRDTYKYVA